KPLPLKTEKCHNIGCLYSISGFLMALTAALKAQIAAWYKALQGAGWGSSSSGSGVSSCCCSTLSTP
ncbi:hypothetical protein E2K67_26100, partial [Escherichia coli]